MLQSLLDPYSLDTQKYIATHIFCPLQLPNGDDHTVKNDHSLASAVASAAHIYCDHLGRANDSGWGKLSRMLDNICATVQFESLDRSRTALQLMSMDTGDILAFIIRAQNAAIIFRKQPDVTIVESFEVSTKAENVMAAQGKLLCSYPGPAIEISNRHFHDTAFLSELANFLFCMNKDVLDAAPTSRKAQTTVTETRDTTHPRYITELLTGILRSFGSPANVTRISKRVGDDVAWNNSKLPWRRSSLWLVIRVALQISLNRSPSGNDTYKEFMLFFMCLLAKEKFSEDLPNDLLQSMSAKISRRIAKLGSSPDWLSRIVSETSSSIQSILEKRWRQVRAAQRVSPVWTPFQLDLPQDIRLSLQNSGGYIRNSLANRGTSAVDTPFIPNHRPRGTLDDFLSLDGAFFRAAYQAEPRLTLYDVEWTVEEGIDGWVDRVADSDSACKKLELLMKEYSSSALTTYKNNPELLSVMLLTTIELWVAIDKIVVKTIPIFADYSPEIPTNLLEDLLLSKRPSLSRLRLIHQYLSCRHSRSQSWTVFSQTITSDSFAVRFYRGSSRLQSLKTSIEHVAQGEVREKIAELEKKNARYAKLQRQVASTDHQFAIDWQGCQYHVRSCTKCSLEKKCQKMEIAVHEWPLPNVQLRAEAVVFELDCPVSFNMWRTATFHLLVDLCSSTVERKDPYILLSKYTGLQRYHVQHPQSRITLASDAKPFIVTHYKKLSLPTTQEQVCVKNGLNFYGFDSSAHIPVWQLPGGPSTRKYCTHALPLGHYNNLQKYVDTTCHSSNEVVADQADCHRDLSIHEYMAFGHLRSGGLLQWLNILRELRGRLFTFRRPEVHLLFAQTVSQVGPTYNSGWKWHQELQNSTFCHALLGELEKLVLDIQANWLEVVTMDTISFLLRRLLASNSDFVVSTRAIELLRVVRGKVFSWVEELVDKIAKAPGAGDFRGFLRDAAAVCRSTFDVDPATIPELLYSAQDVEVLVCCAVFIHDHTPSAASSLSAYSQLLLDRDRRLSLVIENTLRRLIQDDPCDDGINLAARRLWPGHRPGSKWSPLRDAASRWISCRTAPTAMERSQVVHFNLLDGSLLVNGKPLGRLPSDILQHPVYNLIFGEQLLDIIPSDLPGMDYTTRGEISGHQVYFTLRNQALVIRAKRQVSNGSEIVELIPQEKLHGDLPAILIEGHAHWLNLSTSIMEIRPLDTRWETSPANWKMYCIPGQYCMRRGDEFLIDIRSPSWKMVSALLSPFDIPTNLVVSASSLKPVRSSSLQLSVTLPRYGLSFYVDEDGDLQSCNIRGMVYDENQSIWTMFGLVNRLVLRPKTRSADAVDLVPRCVLIPEGQISFQKDGDHVRVQVHIQGPALERVEYQIYRIDTVLGCLTGNVSLTNKLYCAYLHALTSGCGTDPLTGRSGTEEALSLLRSAGCQSILKFSRRDAELLSLVASICPSRTWYPPHRRCMQKVDWNDLPATSQHHDLYIVSKAIVEHYEKVQLFHEDSTSPLFEEFPSRDEHLLERSARRMAYLFPSELSSRHPTESNGNVCYPSRDVVKQGSGEHRSYVAATAVFHRTASATTIKNLLSMAESWRDTISGDATLSFQYDASWLNPDLPWIWLKAYKLLRTCHERTWSQLLFSMSAMAYAKPELSDLVPVFVAFALDPRFRSEDSPLYTSYTLSDGYAPSAATLRGYVSICAHPLASSPEGSEPARDGESSKKLRKRRSEKYNSRVGADAEKVANKLLQGWPCEIIPQFSLDSSLYDVTKFTSNARSHFSSCFRNLKLKEHLQRVRSILYDVQHAQAIPFLDPEYSFHPSQSIDPSSVVWLPTLKQLFSRAAPILRARDELPRYATGVQNTPQPGLAPLRRLIATAEDHATDSFHRRYIAALRDSAKFLGSDATYLVHAETKLPTSEELIEHYARCRDSYIEAFDTLSEYLGPKNPHERALLQSGQWPRITPYVLFQSLASNSPIALSNDWKHCLVTFALIALKLQRARRLLRLHLDNHGEEVRKELQNEGCDGWDAGTYPDWLLIQLQSNFLVRRVQAEVAHEMVFPRSDNNTAMQLNMGEGKSSVIVPIIVSVLADGHQLVRVIVPKALTVQMFHVLVDRLGGLVNRRLYFLPFSRSVKLNDQKVAVLRELLSQCIKKRGVLVVQPEHMLSLKLLSVEKQLPIAKGTGTANQLLELQKWLHSHSRDILDESDEILHVRYQLVYTIGSQHHMEGFPERWTTTEQILGLVSKCAAFLSELFPREVEYQRGPPGAFPHLRILHASEAGRSLIILIVQDVMDGLLPKFNFGPLRSGVKDAIRAFISREDISPDVIRSVKNYAQQTSLWTGLLHLRGLLACGILLFAFRERRWRVDYGLAPKRTMLAVPYRAKDVPAQRAEFGHPDIAIILTCLSYYYGGLSEEQLRLSFEILFKQEDPSSDYELWVQDCSAVPASLKTLGGVNIKSPDQWKDQLFPLFRQNRATVDFYLSTVVFPKEAKEFPSKLSCSGWDLAEKKQRLLTGFSGTNDGRYLLPLHISQRDPDHQRGTNAKVISYLLQPENNHYMCTSHDSGERRTTREFLEILVAQNPPIRVLLDVGAQMLDLHNCGLAQAWLEMNSDASAAIYFNEDDELMVRTRDGSTQLLLSSPFAQQLDQCVVYLDDAHTRGTDIKFPSGFRAAVTLGPKVTKDRLAQGCMRMRKLGYGHSIMFFAPLEVDRRIRSISRKGPWSDINTTDILHWAIRETCDDIQRRAPHWAQQGIDHTARYAAWTSFCADNLTAAQLSDKWLQPEAKKLEDLYGPHTNSNLALLAVPAIHRRCVKLGIMSLGDVSMDEEQEREVIHEVERERQVERPPRVSPANHFVHPDLLKFMKSGVIPTHSDAFRPAFATLDATSAAFDEVDAWSRDVLTTKDFALTVGSSEGMDEYLRPVQWVVSTKMANKETLVILSPHEANYLMPHFWSNSKVHLHLYTPRVAKSMEPCDDLSLYSVPRPPIGWIPPATLMDQLNAFAGQLYLKDYRTYIVSSACTQGTWKTKKISRLTVTGSFHPTVGQATCGASPHFRGRHWAR